jgi:hypothetical protein
MRSCTVNARLPPARRAVNGNTLRRPASRCLQGPRVRAEVEPERITSQRAHRGDESMGAQAAMDSASAAATLQQLAPLLQVRACVSVFQRHERCGATGTET